MRSCRVSWGCFKCSGSEVFERQIISNDTTYTKGGWTPYNGRKVKGVPVRTIVRGKKVMLDGKIVGKPGEGQLIKPIS